MARHELISLRTECSDAGDWVEAASHALSAAEKLCQETRLRRLVPYVKHWPLPVVRDRIDLSPSEEERRHCKSSVCAAQLEQRIEKVSDLSRKRGLEAAQRAVHHHDLGVRR
jgi:hypothetical protein